MDPCSVREHINYSFSIGIAKAHNITILNNQGYIFQPWIHGKPPHIHWAREYAPKTLLHSRHNTEKSYLLIWARWKKNKENVKHKSKQGKWERWYLAHADAHHTHFSCLRSWLCARLSASGPLARRLRCSSLFCWMRASSFVIVAIPRMESFIP